MSFDANDAGTDVDGLRRQIVTWNQVGGAAPSLAVAAGDDAA